MPAHHLKKRSATIQDRNAKIPVAIDTGGWTRSVLRIHSGSAGDFARARDLIDEFGRAIGAESAIPRTSAPPTLLNLVLKCCAVTPKRAGCAAENLLEVSQEYGTKLFLVSAEVYGSWARTRLHDRDRQARNFEQALVAYADQGNKIWLPLYQGRLAEIEADGED